MNVLSTRHHKQLTNRKSSVTTAEERSVVKQFGTDGLNFVFGCTNLTLAPSGSLMNKHVQAELVIEHHSPNNPTKLHAKNTKINTKLKLITVCHCKTFAVAFPSICFIRLKFIMIFCWSNMKYDWFLYLLRSQDTTRYHEMLLKAIKCHLDFSFLK